MISFSDVTKSFQNVAAIQGITLDINTNATTVLLGTSGCGKSTLLRLITGLIKPDTGSITWFGDSLTDFVIDEIRQQVGYVIQDGGLFPHLNARENITIMAKYHGWDRLRIEARIEELTTLTHLEPELLRKHPHQLSGGQKQRIGLMRGLMMEPKVLLLDEPMGALDPITRADLQDDLKQIFANLQQTVVLVTHDIGEAFYLGHKIALMNKGKLVQLGTAEELLEHPANAFVEKFINAQRYRHPLGGEI